MMILLRSFFSLGSKLPSGANTTQILEWRMETKGKSEVNFTGVERDMKGMKGQLFTFYGKKQSEG